MAEFPGFRRSSVLANTWLNALTAQGAILNGAWDSILKGNYGRKDLMRDAALVYQSHFDVIDSLLPNDQSSLPNVPSWLTLDATKSRTLDALNGNVAIRQFDNVNGNLLATPLAAFSGTDARFLMQVKVIDSTHLYVVVTTLTYGTGNTGNVGTGTSSKSPIVLDSDNKIAAAASDQPGTYLGLIFDERAGTNAPLAVVTLMI